MRTLVFDELTFSAAHYIPDHPKCSRLHGHTYFIKDLEVQCQEFVDIGSIKETIKRLDHVILIPERHIEIWESIIENYSAFLVVFFPIKDTPTVEDISVELAKLLKQLKGVVDVSFELYEGPNQGVAYP